MSHSNHLSIDIVRDDQSNPAHMDPACDVVESLSRQVGHIGLGRVGRAYTFRTPIAEMDLRRYEWNFHTADLHVMITDQRMATIRGRVVRGVSWILDSDYAIGERHALVSHSEPNLTRVTTGHEIGHLLLGHGHCSDESCQMHEHITEAFVTRFSQSKTCVAYCDNCLESIDTAASRLYWQRMNAEK